jgi:hypothetical protein
MFTFLLGVLIGAGGYRLGGPLLKFYLRKETQLKKELEEL